VHNEVVVFVQSLRREKTARRRRIFGKRIYTTGGREGLRKCVGRAHLQARDDGRRRHRVESGDGDGCDDRDTWIFMGWPSHRRFRYKTIRFQRAHRARVFSLIAHCCFSLAADVVGNTRKPVRLFTGRTDGDSRRSNTIVYGNDNNEYSNARSSYGTVRIIYMYVH